MIKVGDRIPNATLFESTEFGQACPLSPKAVDVHEATRGKHIVIFGLPGAYTPTCSAQHVPGYLAAYEALKTKGVDEVWCVSVNDGFVMAAWGREQKAIGKIRMLGDGSAELAKKLGIEKEIPGMGTRMQRFSMYVVDGVVKSFNLEAAGKFDVSNAETMLGQVG